MKYFSLGKLAILLGLILAFILALSVTHTVSPGHAGVVNDKLFGGVQDYTLGQGWNWVSPTASVVEYPVSTDVAYYTKDSHEGRTTDDSITIGTKDGKTMKVDAQITYHMERGGLPHIYNTFKGASTETIEYGYMRQNFQRIANDISSHYSMMDIVGEKKSEYNAELSKATKEFFAVNEIMIEEAALGKVEPDEATKNAIQAVANAQYAERQAMYEKNAADAQAKTKVSVADGNAQAQRIEADAQAYANRVIQQSLTPELVQLKWIEKWDGKQSQYQLGSGQGLILNVGNK